MFFKPFVINQAIITDKASPSKLACNSQTLCFHKDARDLALGMVLAGIQTRQVKRMVPAGRRMQRTRSSQVGTVSFSV